MSKRKRISLWPGILIVILGATVMVYVSMFIVINSNPGMTLDMRDVQTTAKSDHHASHPTEHGQQ